MVYSEAHRIEPHPWDASRKGLGWAVGGSPTRNVRLLVVTGILGGRGSRSKILNYLEPRSIFWKVNLSPKTKAFSKQNKGHLGSR